MNCVSHPSVETRVTCSDCGAPICPDCMVFTAVGAKCPACARMPRRALIRVQPDRMVLTVILGLVSAAVGGYLFALLLSMVSFFAIIAAFGLGFGIGEVISWSSGRHHSTRLAAWSAICAALAVLFPFLLSAIYSVISYGSTAVAPALQYVVTGGGIWKLLWIAAAAYGAWQRNA